MEFLPGNTWIRAYPLQLAVETTTAFLTLTDAVITTCAAIQGVLCPRLHAKEKLNGRILNQGIRGEELAKRKWLVLRFKRALSAPSSMPPPIPEPPPRA